MTVPLSAPLSAPAPRQASAWRDDPTRHLVFMFSGQGTHYYQMGRELFDQQPDFRRHLLALGDMGRALCGIDVIGALYDEARRKHHVFDDITITHPAIYMIEVALARALQDHGVRPDAVLGVSMGNFAAATVAGSLRVEAGLAAVCAQARALHDHTEAGAMLAVLGSAALHGDHAMLREHSEIAAVNTPSSFILSLPAARCESIEAYLRAHQINFQRMAVARAFHSRWIDDAQLAHPACELASPRIAWFCATQGGLVASHDAAHLWRAVRQPVRMQVTLDALEAAGRFDYLDLGPSGSLAVLLKYVLAPQAAARYTHVMSAFGSDLARFEGVTARP